MPDLGDPNTRIETPELAIRRMEGLVTRLVQLSNTRTVEIADNPDATRRVQANAEQHWLMTYGQAVGTLVALRQCGLLRRGPYRLFKRKVQRAFVGEQHTAINKRNEVPARMSQEGLVKHIDHLCETVVRYREECNVEIPGDQATTARVQRAAYNRWNIYYGQAIGTLITYRQASQIEDMAYELMKAKVQATLASRVVGTIQAPIQPPHGVRVV